MYESRKVQQGLRGWPREDDSHVLVPLFRNSETWLRYPLEFEVDGRSRKGILSLFLSDFGENSTKSVVGVRRSCIAAIYFSSYMPALKAKTEGADPPVTISRKAHLGCYSKRPQPLPSMGHISN